MQQQILRQELVACKEALMQQQILRQELVASEEVSNTWRSILILEARGSIGPSAVGWKSQATYSSHLIMAASTQHLIMAASSHLIMAASNHT